MPSVEVKVPDIGDFKDVPVIDVLVKPGDSVKPEDPLVTLESDKATMDVPSPAAGTVKAIAVKVGDKVSQGSVVLTLEAESGPARPAPTEAKRASAAPASPPAPAAQPARPAASAPAPAPATQASKPAAAQAPQPSAGPATFTGRADVECEML